MQKVLCGVKELGHLGPLYIKSKAHIEEEEMPEDKWRRSKFPRSIAEDNPVLDELRS